MKLALIYIAVIIAVYIVVDIILYIMSSSDTRRLLRAGRKIPRGEDTEKTLEKIRAFHQDVIDWIENEHKLEYKCVWVGNRLADALEALRRRYEDDMPEDFRDQLDKTATTLRGFGPKYVWTLVKAFGIAILLALFIRSFLVQAFKIPSGSMIPTLYVGDQLLVNKFKYGVEIPFTNKRLFNLWEPRRGDIVVFRPPRSVDSSWVTHEIRVPFTGRILYKWRSQVDFIKRVVGLPGDKVEVKDGVLYINDLEMPLTPVEEFDYKKKTGNYVRMVETLEFIETIDGKEHLVIHNDVDIDHMEGENYGPYHIGPGELFAMGDNRDDSQDSRTWVGDPARLEDIRGKAFIIHFSWDSVEGRPRIRRIGKLIH